MRRDHFILSLFALVMSAPMILAFVFSATSGGLRGEWQNAGFAGLEGNLTRLTELTSAMSAPNLIGMMWASFAVASGVACLGTVFGFLAAYVLVFFSNPMARMCFALSLMTLYFPIEARMLPTFDVTAALGLVDRWLGLVLPVLPLAVSVFLFRQHFKSLPSELAEAARIDGAGPVRYLVDFVLPLSKAQIAVVLIISFVIGWNQYLWPIVVSVENRYVTLMRGLNLVGAGSGPSMLIAATSLLPPLVLILGFQRLLSRATHADG